MFALVVAIVAIAASEAQDFEGPILLNYGANCWKPCNKTQGACEYCGDGLCCRKGFTKDYSGGCDGTFGGRNQHTCTLPCNSAGKCTDEVNAAYFG